MVIAFIYLSIIQWKANIPYVVSLWILLF